MAAKKEVKEEAAKTFTPTSTPVVKKKEEEPAVPSPTYAGLKLAEHKAFADAREEMKKRNQ